MRRTRKHKGGNMEEALRRIEACKDIPSCDLNLSYLSLSTLPEIPDNVEILDCSGNLLTSLPELPKSIKKLYCYDNKLTSIDKLPDNLIDLVCEFNNLTSLPELPKSLKKLTCNNNDLTTLPTLPENLSEIICRRNNISSLPELPESLTKLNCNTNKLETLPKLPKNLEKLECHINKLTTLPELPESLISLDCSINELITLPKLPDNLEFLYCNNNNLTTLPKLPNGLIGIYAGNNQLTSRPLLPSSVEQAVFNENPFNNNVNHNHLNYYNNNNNNNNNFNNYNNNSNNSNNNNNNNTNNIKESSEFNIGSAPSQCFDPYMVSNVNITTEQVVFYIFKKPSNKNKQPTLSSVACIDNPNNNTSNVFNQFIKKDTYKYYQCKPSVPKGALFITTDSVFKKPLRRLALQQNIYIYESQAKKIKPSKRYALVPTDEKVGRIVSTDILKGGTVVSGEHCQTEYTDSIYEVFEITEKQNGGKILKKLHHKTMKTRKQKGKGCGCVTPQPKVPFMALPSEASMGPLTAALYKGGACPCRAVPPVPTPLSGGYRPTKRNLKYLKKWKRGESIGFTMRSSLKAKGLIPRANGTKKVSPKYR